jgi:hypothetical protein
MTTPIPIADQVRAALLAEPHRPDQAFSRRFKVGHALVAELRAQLAHEFICPRCGWPSEQSLKRPEMCKPCSVRLDAPQLRADPALTMRAPTPQPQPCPPALPPPVDAPPPRQPRQRRPDAAQIAALSEIDVRCEALADLADRLGEVKARPVRLRWLQMRWQRVALERCL